ncbi:hypothetical protein [Tolypothrix sp. VBCCA 56010]
MSRSTLKHQCPMPNAPCPMPHAPCPIPQHRKKTLASENDKLP